jgi:transposase
MRRCCCANCAGAVKGSKEESRHSNDPDARIKKMKDGRTHLVHEAEHAVDLETGAIMAVTVQAADEGDTTTIVETVAEAGQRIPNNSPSPPH